MTIKKPASKKAETESSTEYLVDQVINAGSPPPPTDVAPIVEEKEIKFQMVISPELCRSIDGARKLSKTSRRAWLLQAAQEKLEREGKML
jgi:hypothetical protein